MFTVTDLENTPMTSTISTGERFGWILAFGLLVAFAIPWFLWGNDQLLVGLPVWLWWHVGWMVIAALVFWLFSRRAWGVGIPDSGLTESEGRGQA